MVDVFISYARTDQKMVRQLAEAVKREGYGVWWDEELPPHLSYGDVITEKIGAAKAAIVVWSQEAAASEWVRAEADVARNQKKLIQTSIDARMPPMPFNQIQFASIGDWRGEDDHPGWNKVKASLRALCGPGGERKTPPPSVAAAARPARAAGSRAVLIPLLAGLLALAVLATGYLFWSRGGTPALKDVRVETENRIAPTPAPPPAPTDDLFSQAALIDDPDGFTNLRGGPSAEALVVGRVNQGEVFTTYSQPGDWWRVRTADGTIGYMAASRIRVMAPGAAAPEAAAEPEAEPGQVFADSSRRQLSAAELEDMSVDELRLARNEIFARHGRAFRDPALRRHFRRYRWYREQAAEVVLSPIEEANVRLLQQAETW